jgi:hypothetical protein
MYPLVIKNPTPALILPPYVRISPPDVSGDPTHALEAEDTESAVDIAVLNALYNHFSDLIIFFFDEENADKAEKVYQTCLQKGRVLYDMMLADSTQPSPFACPSALSTWGWETSVQPDSYGLECEAKHTNPTQHNGETYPAVEKARYLNNINPQKGRIEAIYTRSPMYADGKKLAPELCRWSDVTFLQLKSITSNAARRSLRQVIRENICNKTTCKVIDALKAKHDLQARRVETLKHANGLAATDTIYRVNEEDALALLGTPNGAGVAYMLIQHRADLGHLAIDEVRLRHVHDVFLEKFTLIFGIKPVEIVKARLGLARIGKSVRPEPLRGELHRNFYG